MRKNKRHKIAARVITYMMMLSLTVCLIAHLCKTLNYGSWEVSEWMINYEAGFIRRGICGQLLYELYQIVPYNIITGIKIIEVIPAIAFLYIIINIFKKEGWAPLILVSGCCLFYTLFFFLRWARKDFIMLTMTYAIYICYRNTVRNANMRDTVTFIILSSLQMLIHEAAFFFTFPILLVWRWTSLAKEKARFMAFAKACIPFIPALITFAIVVTNKGDEAQAAQIWQSWQEAMMAYPDRDNAPEVIGSGVEALGWTTKFAFNWHLSSAYLGEEEVIKWYHYLSPLLVIVNFMCTYYFITRLNTVKLRTYKLTSKDTGIRISNFLLLQFIFLLPMFTVLSCDWGRTLPYWTLSSLMACHIFNDIKISAINRLSETFQRRLSGYPFNNPYFYIALMLITPYAKCYAPLLSDSILGKLLL